MEHFRRLQVIFRVYDGVALAQKTGNMRKNRIKELLLAGGIAIATIISGCDPAPLKPETEGNETELPGDEELDGLAYVFDFEAIPEITLHFKVDQWNELLTKYDNNPNTKEYVHCDVSWKKGEDNIRINNAAVRLRGNTSRRRPEGSNGERHISGKTDWHHCHFGLNLRKYEKDDEHEIRGIRKMNLKWFKDDPNYVRELFSYDLFERAGVWTAAQASYARLSIFVAGDKAPAYYGIYSLIEPYDNRYLKRKEELFGSADGNLWKCCYTGGGPADLRSINADFGEDDNIHEYTYELKESGSDFEQAKAQLQNFIKHLNNESDANFKQWFESVCDVPLLLRTYAVNVGLGMWDDLWNNGNNYYLYFNSQDLSKYKVYLLPYDYDNTLGTGIGFDPGLQDPTDWGNTGLLMERIMKVPEFKELYISELKRLVNPNNRLMDYFSSKARIQEWQERIKDYVPNDTGEDMSIRDEAASWSSYKYKLLSTGYNFFINKEQSIRSL